MNKITKGWGHELVMHNDDGYCFKQLVFVAGKAGSFHLHAHKTETWFVAEGIFQMNWIDGTTAKRSERTLVKGMVVHLPAGTPHRLKCVEDGVIIEASTPHTDDDVIRIEPGDSQQ
jgi:mannose-6-phosphate isomerase-like protein (cupin superfamily)